MSISTIVSIFTVSACLFLTLTPNIPILYTALPQHIIISPIHCTGYTALLKTLTVTLSEMHCHAIMMHNDYTIHLYCWPYKLTVTHEEL